MYGQWNRILRQPICYLITDVAFLLRSLLHHKRYANERTPKELLGEAFVVEPAPDTIRGKGLQKFLPRVRPSFNRLPIR